VGLAFPHRAKVERLTPLTFASTSRLTPRMLLMTGDSVMVPTLTCQKTGNRRHASAVRKSIQLPMG
jgi:hypothetical protein